MLAMYATPSLSLFSVLAPHLRDLGRAASSCKSYSYNAEKKLCVASQDALSYDQDFVFYAKKEGHMDANSKLFPILHAPSTLTNFAFAAPGAAGYHEPFPGLTYKPSGWTKLSGKTLADCMALCSKGHLSASSICHTLWLPESCLTCSVSHSDIL